MIPLRSRVGHKIQIQEVWGHFCWGCLLALFLGERGVYRAVMFLVFFFVLLFTICNGSPRLCLVMSTSLTVPGIRQGSLLNSMVGYDLFDPSLNR